MPTPSEVIDLIRMAENGISTLDGEWLGEHWPVLQAMSLWPFTSIMIGLSSIDYIDRKNA